MVQGRVTVAVADRRFHRKRVRATAILIAICLSESKESAETLAAAHAQIARSLVDEKTTLNA